MAEIHFQNPMTTQFRCVGCGTYLTWARYPSQTKGGEVCRQLVDRKNCQERMLGARCPVCSQIYAKQMVRSQLVSNEELEQATL